MYPFLSRCFPYGMVLILHSSLFTYAEELYSKRDPDTNLLPDRYPEAFDSNDEYPIQDQNMNYPYPMNKHSLNNYEYPTLNIDAALRKLNQSYIWVNGWLKKNIKLGQVSGVATSSKGILVLQRGSHVWDQTSFTEDNRYTTPLKPPISQPTVLVCSAVGDVIDAWGENLFYMPHGITEDKWGNVWITDVALHQVFKFSSDDLKQPKLILGTRFEPGNDDSHFCKPSAVAVTKTGDFFISDGYCNHRIIKYNEHGVKILQWGRGNMQGERKLVPPPYSFLVPHALALVEEYGQVCVADRENGRIQCFYCNNGTFVTQYHSSVIGTRLFSVAYSPAKGGRLFVVNGPVPLWPSNAVMPVRGFVIDFKTGKLLSQFSPNTGDFENPHDIAVSTDGKSVYVVELDPCVVHKFVDISTNSKNDSNTAHFNQTNTGQHDTMDVGNPLQQKGPGALKLATTEETFGKQNGVSSSKWAAIGGLVTAGLAALTGLVAAVFNVVRGRNQSGWAGSAVVRNRRQRWDYVSRPGAPDFKLRRLLEPRGFQRVRTDESDDEPTPATTMLAPQTA